MGQPGKNPLSRCEQPPPEQLDLTAVGMAAHREINIPSLYPVPPDLRLVAQQQAEFRLRFKPVQEFQVRRSRPPAAQPAEPDSPEQGAFVPQERYAVFFSQIHVYGGIPDFHLVVSH